MSDTIVRGEGNAPGQGPGEPMPSVNTTERAGLDTMRDVLARKNAEADSRGGRPVPPPSARSRTAEFSERLERSQQAPTLPGEARKDPEPIKGAPDKPPPRPESQATKPSNGQIDGQTDGQNVDGDELDALAGDESLEQEPGIAPTDAELLAKAKEWQSGDLFPDELLEKLHPVKVNGRELYVDGKELRQGYMRGGDYRRQFQEVQVREQRAQQTEQFYQQHFEAVRDPNQMLEIYERNGYGETLEKVAVLIAQRRRETNRIVQGAGYAAMHQFNTQDENDHRVVAAMEATRRRLQDANAVETEKRRIAFEKSQLQQTKQQTQHEQETERYKAVYENQLNQLRPLAFRANGIKDTAANRQAIARHLSNVIATNGFNGDITRDMLMEAARDLREELDDRFAQERAADQQPRQGAPQRRPLPPRGAGMGAGSPLQGNGAKRGSLSDLEAMVRNNRQNR